MTDLSRLFRPSTIAVIGGGAWCRSVIEQCRKMGFQGAIWPVHPKASEVGGLSAYPSLSALPTAPDVSFVGVNRLQTINIVHELATIGAGGAVCFASGFLEAEAEDEQGPELQRQLLAAAGAMPILGPNCYGFINYLDGALLWPDQHGGIRAERGVALITQSSNMAINLTMQKRGLPLAYVVTAGNQAQTGIAAIGEALLQDERVTALGLHIEGFGDLRAFERLAAKAADLGKPIVALKVGKSVQAQVATISHTASLAGGDAGAQALLERLGIPRLGSLSDFLETLKILHVYGPLTSNRIASISCSGGEASLIADTAVGRNVTFPPLNATQKTDLRAALGPMVALANPLDYHTYIWRDTPAMTRAWAAMMDPSLALTMLIVDFPRADRCDSSDWECTIAAALAARQQTGANVAMVSSLAELMPEDVAARLIAGGVVPINGLTEAIAATEAAVMRGRVDDAGPLVLTPTPINPGLIPEATAKTMLADYGLAVPKALRADSPEQAGRCAAEIGFPVVLKGEGIAHKTEAGAVVLGLMSAGEVEKSASAMPAKSFLIEEMITGTVAELLIGVVHDPAHGFVLTIAAGGILTELLDDSTSLLVPSTSEMIGAALERLKIAKLLNGYRGKPAADKSAIVAAIMAVQDYVINNAIGLAEVEVNPLLCGPNRAVAGDALLRREDLT
ncbi:MAG: acetate--CoA ligase family protein [Rhodobacter sp.]|jgi:acyl-CoA synthetase (NDP forming)|nr:acetate--CoA ligase family protein [Rhodobacter sp.]